MKTRSQTKELYIDFDEASSAWMANKRKMKDGSYIYTCEYICKNSNTCQQECLKNFFFCKRHLRYTK